MLRCVVWQQASGLLLFLLLTPLSAQTVIWPDQFGRFAKTGSERIPLADPALWDEYGFQQAEEADYSAGAEKFKALAWRLKDPTRAMAAFQWQRRPGDRPSKLGTLAVETQDGVQLAYGNYLFRFEGYKPQVAELEPLFERLPRLDQSSLPALAGYLPPHGLAPNSERFVIGPESLARFAPRIPPSVAGFHLDAEAQIGTYQTAKGDLNLAIFSYPTPQIARQQAAALEKLPGALVRRSGPLVSVVFSPPDPDEAERLLAAVRYEPEVSLSQYVPTQRDNIGNLIINIFVLIGLLLVFCTMAGLAVAGVRRLTLGTHPGDPMTILHLEDHSWPK